MYSKMSLRLATKIKNFYVPEVRQKEVDKVDGNHLTNKWLQIVKEQLKK